MSGLPLARWLIGRFVRAEDRRFLLGDLDEEHGARVLRDGARAAGRWYRNQLVRSFIPLISQKFVRRHPTPREPMQYTVENVARDFGNAARSLRRAPSFSVIALVTLMLGIGATTIIFGLAYTIWLRPLPFAHPENLLTVRDAYHGGGGGSANVSAADIAALERLPSIAGVAAYGYSAAITKVGGETVRLLSFRVSNNFFSVLGVAPALGRTFTPDESKGTTAVVMLSDAFWRSHFNRDPAVVGKSIDLFGQAHTIVGVMPPHFEFPSYSPSDMWVPLIGDAATERQRILYAVARRKLDAPLARLRAEISTLSMQQQLADPATWKGWSMVATPLVEQTVGGYRAALGVLLGAVGVLLMIACANIGSLFLVRNVARRNELAVRAALGATRARLSLQVFAECMTLALVGGAGGVVLAYFGAPLLGSMLPAGTPRIAEFAVDARIVLFAGAVSLATGLLCALLPAARLSLVALSESLKDSGRGAIASGSVRPQQSLIVLQVALSLMLMIGSGLMLRSFFALLQVDRGFSTENLLTMDIVLPFDRFGESASRMQAYRDLTDRLNQVPGVVSTGMVTGFPGSAIGVLDGGQVSSSPGDPKRTAGVLIHASTPAYFTTMRVPLIAGRYFSADDRAGAPPVVIINQTIANKLWPNENAVGRTVSLPTTWGMLPPNTPMLIVGVVGDMRNGSEPAAGDMFVPTYQVAGFWIDIAIRTSVPAEQISGAVRTALHGFDADLLIEHPQSMDRIISNGVSLQRTQSVVAGLFGVLATLLSVVGLYGVVSHQVGQRRREIGIRMALGASRGEVFGMVITHGMMLTFIGLVIGTLGAMALVRVLHASVFGLSHADPRIFAGAAIALLIAALLACYLPARRAMGVDPIASMR